MKPEIQIFSFGWFEGHYSHQGLGMDEIGFIHRFILDGTEDRIDAKVLMTEFRSRFRIEGGYLLPN